MRGNTQASAAQRSDQNLRSLYNPGAKRNTLIANDCTNDPNQYDITLTAAGGTECAKRSIAMALKWAALGANAGAVIVPPPLATGLYNNGAGTFLPAVWAYLRANCPKSSRIVCMVDSDPIFYSSNASTNTTYYYDGTHHTTAGYQYRAKNLEAPGYNVLWNSSTDASPTTIGSTANYTIRPQDQFTRVYNGGAGVPNLYLPNCPSLSGDYTITLDSTVRATVFNATSAQIINSTDNSTTGLSIPYGARLVFTILPSGAGGGCSWRVSQPVISDTKWQNSGSGSSTVTFDTGRAGNGLLVQGAVTLAIANGLYDGQQQTWTFQKDSASGESVAVSGSNILDLNTSSINALATYGRWSQVCTWESHFSAWECAQ